MSRLYRFFAFCEGKGGILDRLCANMVLFKKRKYGKVEI